MLVPCGQCNISVLERRAHHFLASPLANLVPGGHGLLLGRCGFNDGYPLQTKGLTIFGWHRFCFAMLKLAGAAGAL